jgi:hypothetical protein
VFEKFIYMPVNCILPYADRGYLYLLPVLVLTGMVLSYGGLRQARAPFVRQPVVCRSSSVHLEVG